LHSIAATEMGCAVTRARETGCALGTLVGSFVVVSVEGAMVGPAVGAIGAVVGLSVVGPFVGSSDGALVGSAVGALVNIGRIRGGFVGLLAPGKDPKEYGALVGDFIIVGALVGALVGASVVGLEVGALVTGAVVGPGVVGTEVGPLVTGASVGVSVGVAMGLPVGSDVPACRKPASSFQSSLASCPRKRRQRPYGGAGGRPQADLTFSSLALQAQSNLSR
jgi:hypothetical protein